MEKHLLYIKPRNKFSDVITRTFVSSNSYEYSDGRRFESEAIDELVINQKKSLDRYYAQKELEIK